MKVKEWKGSIIFLHEVIAGAADRSYGIHVARLAGLPAAVIHRAEDVLKTLESGEQGSAVARLADDLPLFAVALKRAKQPEPPVEPVVPALSAAEAAALQALRTVNPDDLSPRAALEQLYALKAALSGG